MRGIGLLLGLLFSVQAIAHDTSTSFLKIDANTDTVQAERGTFQWDIAARDLDLVANLDIDGDGEIMGHEVLRSTDDIVTYLDGTLLLSASGMLCEQSLASLDTREVQGRGYLSFKGRYDCAGSQPDSVQYRLFTEENPSHQLLLKLGVDGLTHRLANDGQPLALSRTQQSHWSLFVSFVSDGMHHVAGGLDHVLFLLLLLVPAVLVIRKGRWQPAADLRSVLKHTAWLSAAFAVGHGLSLTLAVLDIFRPPSAWVELGIAASIVIVAVNNVCARYHVANSTLALMFGFIHGFGFASVLSGQALGTGELVIALLGFNLGIELFQLMLVLALVPLLFYVRSKKSYVRYMLNGTAALCSITAVQLMYSRLLML